MLEHIGSNIFHLGEAGAGCLFKLLNNVIILCGNQIVQEALVLGVKAGLDPEDLVEKLRLGTARPYMGLAPYLLGKRFDNPSFTLRLAEKDVSLAIEAARANQVPMPVANAAHQTYQGAERRPRRAVLPRHPAGDRGGGRDRNPYHPDRRRQSFALAPTLRKWRAE